jgi:Domain of unknown function (DUF5666)
MFTLSQDTKFQPQTNALFGAIVFVALACLLALTGCGNSQPTASTAGTVINFGDAPNDQIIAFELTVNAVTLTGGSNPSVLPKPTEIELTHDMLTFEPLSLATIPPGTYTAATFSVSNPEVVVVDPTTKAVTKLNATLTSSTVNVPFPSPISIGTGASVLNFDMNLNSSVTISGSNATVTPTFTVSTATIAAGSESNENENDGELEDLRGTITSVASPKFTIQPAQTAQPVTITTDANTKFEDGITSFSSLQNGMIVSVDATTQADGSILAKKVESETETPDGEEVEGLVTNVTCAVATACPSTGNAATAIAITTQKVSATSAANAPVTATTVNVPITASTQFTIHSNMSGGSFPAFDATSISKAQRVEVDSESEASNTSNSVAASKIRLQEQGFTGTVSALSGSNFTLTVDANSAFASLTGQTTIAVQAGNARNEGVSLANNATIRVRGLLFFNGTSYTLIASRVAP